ncbi:alpha/beta hydrolase family protein [Halosimplex sp. TS25]|uniref:alpha/beta hydrolase family protein n=1 Tax=Halosimplex rarum TaxID=3396619 RepID=UPI0039EA70EA
MDGFGDAVDGYFDVEDQLSRYLLRRAEARLGSSGGTGTLDDVESRADAETHRERVRSFLTASIGGLPDRPADLGVETTDRREREGYGVECVTFESRPDYHVTANCYVPDGDGPHPGILFLCGHAGPAREDEWNQRACIDLAENGFVVLVVDPLGQGERRQYEDLDHDDAKVSGGGGVFPHSYAGQKCFYAGTNLARYVIHDDRCALDYLCGRPDVDEERIGVTGTSGGGLQTIYLSLLDDRVDAAAPCCSVSERYEQLKTGNRTHAEQALVGSVDRGIDYDDLLAALAPLPLRVGAAAHDRYFPIEGVHDAFDRVRDVYACYDAEDEVDLTVADAPHCAVWEFRDDVFEWLCDRLDAGEYRPVRDLAPLDESAVRCTESGNVLDEYADERTIDEVIAAHVTARYPDGGASPRVDDGGDYGEQLRATVTERFDLDREACDLHPRVVHRTTEDGVAVERVWFRTERDPDAVVAGVLASDPETDPESPAVVLFDRGTAELPERSEAVASLAEAYGAVLVFDPRGVGAVRNRTIPVPSWADDYYGTFGTEFKFANDALLLDTSLLAMRVFDVLRAADVLRSETGAAQVSFVGEGVGSYHALYAAAVAENVARVELSDLGPSFYEMATRRAVPFDSRLTVADVIGDCDLPHLLAALEQRGIPVDRGASER